MIKSDVSLKEFNTFNLDERCRFFCRVATEEELQTALDFAATRSLPRLVLGGGSNILLTREFPGLVIKIDNHGIERLELSDQEVKIRVSAGENWHALVLHSLNCGWYGLENLSLIPGSVGAAPMQNIGAYGAEVGKWIHSVRYYHTESQSWKEISAEECRFGYRDSIFKNELRGKAIIWEVTFLLSRIPEISLSYGDIAGVLRDAGIDHPGPQDISTAVMKIRRSKLPDPADLGNAGSFFKNPVIPVQRFTALRKQWPALPSYPASEGMVKISAGWLIEHSGWKGYRKENCGVHDRQALVLVNYGHASGKDILDLAGEIMKDVKEKTGVDLQPEVNIC